METFEVYNPCNGEVVGVCKKATFEDVNQAIEAAHEAFKLWKKTPVAERVKLQHKAATGMRNKADELANILANELGRPINGCLLEINRSADLLDFYAEEGLRMKGEVTQHNIEGEKALIIREPIGVVGSITPFNYPITLLMMKLGAALVAGCTIVAKPSDDTPLSTLKLCEIFDDAGYPPNVFQVVTGAGRIVGNALVSHPLVSKIAFTGGTSTGKNIGQIAA